MEENKYYTPELKEFHVGFEYKQELGYSWSINTPEDYVIKFQDKIFEIENINFINTLLEAGLIRVKYLDKDDIEKLGFKIISEVKDNCNHRLKCEYPEFTTKIFHFSLLETPPKLIILAKDSSNFVLNIKNKSELKDILEKLGIGF